MKTPRNRLVADELKNDRPHQSVYSRHFGFGDEVEGETQEGTTVQGRITAIGEKTYRIESGKLNHTVDQSTARRLPFEETTEGKRQASQGEIK